MILQSDYIGALIAEYEAEKSRTAPKRAKSLIKRNKLQARNPSPGTLTPGDAFCKWCKRPFRPSRPNQVYDFPRCRTAAYKKRKGEELYARSELRD